MAYTGISPGVRIAENTAQTHCRQSVVGGGLVAGTIGLNAEPRFYNIFLYYCCVVPGPEQNLEARMLN